MKKKTKIWLGVLGGAALIGGTGAVMALRGNDGSSEHRTVEVTRDSLVQKALAVGNIEPDVEIAVKSQISGVVRTLFVEEGAFVSSGEPLLEVAPNPTPIELADSKRQVELREIELVNLLKDVERKRELRSRDFITQEELDRAERDYEQSLVHVQMAKERVDPDGERKRSNRKPEYRRSDPVADRRVRSRDAGGAGRSSGAAVQFPGRNGPHHDGCDERPAVPGDGR